jgi:glycosyltransferase involved in cell wall biosynthesis
MELTVLMPCLNEAETLGRCIEKAKRFFAHSGVKGEVLVADNGSTDGSQSIAEQAGARVVTIPDRGYGAALIGGISAARGKYVIMGDADDSYDFSSLELFVAELRAGADLVMGNRFAGGIKPGAMPFLHRWLGNPVLSAIGRALFTAKVRDFHCGLRGFKRDAILRLNLTAPGMEFASEMIVRASLARLRMTEVPTVLHKDGRSRPPHLRTWRDGWRHLSFLLLYSPRWLLLYPGLLMLVVGALSYMIVVPGTVVFRGIGFDIHTLLFSSCLLILGTQLCQLSVYARIEATNRGYLPTSSKLVASLQLFSLERGVVSGALLVLAGLFLLMALIIKWSASDFGRLDPIESMRLAIPSSTIIVMGWQLIFGSFVLGLFIRKS